MGRKLPKLINQEEFEKIFKHIIKLERDSEFPNRVKRLREYRVAILLGFEAGMRISEIVGYKRGERVVVPALRSEMIEGNNIRILSGKGGKDRVVPKPKRLNDKAIKLLPLNISRRALQNFITKLGKELLNKEISFHTLRHGFGSHLAGRGRPLHEIQILMGHARLDTTGIYLHANPKQAIEGAIDVF